MAAGAVGEAADQVEAPASASEARGGSQLLENKFGLNDPEVVRVLEGLPGVELCRTYQMVEERGGWAQEVARRRGIQAKIKAESIKCVAKFVTRVPTLRAVSMLHSSECWGGIPFRQLVLVT